jgi:hypothetical protein
MRLAPKLVLIAMMAATVVALSTLPASAHVSIRDEPGNADCSPCTVTADSVLNAGSVTGTAFIIMAGGMEISAGVCDDEFNASINENGVGTIFNQQLHGGATCAKKPCGAPSAEAGIGTAWPLEIRETADGSGQFRAEISFCFVTDLGSTAICHLTDITVTEVNHMTVFDAPHIACENSVAPNPVIEVLARWELNGSNLELNHGG